MRGNQDRAPCSTGSSLLALTGNGSSPLWIPFSFSQSLAPKNCILGETLLNSLIGDKAGVEDKGEFEAEERVVGWSDGQPDQLSELGATNLTAVELENCLKEYSRVSGSKPTPSLPPGVTPDKDPSLQQYLPSTSPKHEAVNGFGDKAFSYVTTYDSSGYRFKDKGYVINPPPSPISTETPVTTTSSMVEPTTARPTTKKPASKDELEKWYKAFISVMSKYM